MQEIHPGFRLYRTSYLNRYLLNWDWRTPTNVIQRDLKIFKVENICKYNVLNFGNKFGCVTNSKTFQHFFSLEAALYAVRRKGSLNVQPCRTAYVFKAVKLNGTLLWSNIHGDMKGLGSMPEKLGSVWTLYLYLRMVNCWYIDCMNC